MSCIHSLILFSSAIFSNSGYEVDNGTFDCETGEEMAEAYVQLLKDIHG